MKLRNTAGLWGLVTACALAACDAGTAATTAGSATGTDAAGADTGAVTASDTASGDAATTADGDSASLTGGSIAIYLQGDQLPVTFSDGLQGQTPTEFQVALSRYQVLKSADDPAPQPCFDHGKTPVIADLAGDNLMGQCATSGIATGTYTHGRVKVDWLRYSVTGQLHYNGMALPGKFTFLRAYSDTTVDGKPMSAGAGTLRFRDKSGNVDNEIPFTYPALPSMPSVTTQLQGGEFLMTFAYTKPLPILHDAPGAYWARFHWQVWQGFRWQDSATAGNTAGVWDVQAPPAPSESVIFAGATGYSVTTSID
ncbi:MAG: hypothetical protein HY902_00460 [Deltaproteobacteria bacterium]|nr:hypothetical protein [Deltaproteobacteria bacterium]